MGGGVVRKAGTIVCGAAVGAFVALTIVGMVTGRSQEFDRGTTSGTAVALQMTLGGGFLVLALIGGKSRLPPLWNGRRRAGARVAAWMGAALLLWLIWAVARVIEYSS